MNPVDLEKLKEKKSTDELLKFSIINIDKPSRPTSFSVSDYIRKSFSLNKTSHAGTLDPQVTGVLPIMLSRACRLSNYLMHRDKTYVGIMRIHKSISEEKLNLEIQKFTGKIIQLPPVRSRVKRAPREREVKTFKIIEKENSDFLFETQVQAGTYVRKLINDLGLQIGGAHMLELRRTKAGLFSEKDSITLYDFDKIVEEYKNGSDSSLRKILIPGEIIYHILPTLQIQKQVVKKCLAGSPIFPKFLKDKSDISKLKKDDKVCIFSDEIFIGCYNFIGSEEIIAKPEFVFN